MSCIVCSENSATFGLKCPKCRETVCIRNDCSCKCSTTGCNTIIHCKNCFDKEQYNHYEELKLHGINYSIEYQFEEVVCDKCLPDVQQEYMAEQMDLDNLISDGEACRCGKRTTNLHECGVCGAMSCTECLRYETCHF